MERYSLRKRIPSCFVDKKLLSQIEKYLCERLTKKYKGISERKEIEYKYSITFVDSIGKEKLSTVDEYHREKFQDDIDEIVLSYSVGFSDVDVQIRFSKSVSFSSQSVDISCASAKELALGIKSEIENILDYSKTVHFLFYGRYAIGVYLVWVACSGVLYWFKFKYSDQILFFIVFSSMAYFGLREVAPYSTFDNKKNENISKFTKWILNGLAGVFVFGVIVNYLKSNLL